VVGFDDIALTTDVQPALTTVYQPLEEIGQHGMRLPLDERSSGSLLVLLDGPASPRRLGRLRTVWMPARLVARDSNRSGALLTAVIKLTSTMANSRRVGQRPVTVRMPGVAAEERDDPHCIVCGDDPLTYRLVEELALRYQRRVVVVLRNRLRNQGPELAKIAGVRLIEAERLDADAFRRADIDGAAAVAMVRQDDVGNLHAALLAQELNRDIRLVVRMFNMSLGHGIRVLFTNCAVLSDAAIAAPAFVASALGEVAPSYLRLPGRTLYVAERSDAPIDAVVCGLADTTVGPEPVLLPPDESRCDIVLAVADGRPQHPGTLPPPGGQPSGARRRSQWLERWRAMRANRIFGSVLNRSLQITALILLGVVLAGTVALTFIDRTLSLWQAFYLTVLNTVGGVNPNPGSPIGEQVIQVIVMLAGIAVVPVITAAVVEAVVNARLAADTGRLRGPVADHVVVVGLGNVGTRVLQQLHDLGVPVVAVDRSGEARGAQFARELGVPLVLGDASLAETLREASIETARSLVVLSTDDVTNLEAALHARAARPDLRVVLRLFDGDFAQRVQRVFGITSSKSVSLLAAPAFVAAILEKDVIGTIPVKRHVLVVAEIPVGAGSVLADRTVSGAQQGGQARIIAVTRGEMRHAEWRPGPARQLRAGERLLVVATRAGLGRLLGQSTGYPDDDPVPA
jgi:Trk K+ transport system NAD-binding subunit